MLTIIATFASSEGCSWNMPRSNQPWWPLMFDPSGLSTASSMTMAPT